MPQNTHLQAGCNLGLVEDGEWLPCLANVSQERLNPQQWQPFSN